jgi:hypothetical protein
MRIFSIKTQSDGGVAVTEEDRETEYQFSDMIDALSFVRRQRCGEPVTLVFYDASGRVTKTGQL